MKWFGRKAVREGVRPALARASYGAAIGDWPRSYEAQVREGYALNPVAQRAVKLVAEGVGWAPVAASEPELLRLATARAAGQGLLQTVAAQLLLHGNAYVQLLDDGAGGVGELYALRPERVSVEADASGWPAAYRYKVGERTTRLAADPGSGSGAGAARPEVVHLKGFAPLDDHYGDRKSVV